MNKREKEKEIVKDFKEKILSRDISSLSNEDRVIICYFLDGFLSENYGGAATIGFVFIEKFLRTELIFIKHSESGAPAEKFLESLSEIEELLENGENPKNPIIKKKRTFEESIRKYKIDTNITKEDIFKNLEEYLNTIDSFGTLPQYQLNFNNIVNEFRKRNIFDKEFSQKLIKLYSKYRNPLQHGSFNHLIKNISSREKTLVASGGIPGQGIQLHDISVGNLILRENGIISDIFYGICKEIFNTLCNLLEEKFQKIRL